MRFRFFHCLRCIHSLKQNCFSKHKIFVGLNDRGIVRDHEKTEKKGKGLAIVLFSMSICKLNTMNKKILILSILPLALGIVLYQLILHDIIELGGGDKSLIYGFGLIVFGIIHLVSFWIWRIKVKNINSCFKLSLLTGLVLFFPCTIAVLSVVRSV